MRRCSSPRLRCLFLLCVCACARVAGEAATGRVLACYWGLDRAADVTFASFQKYVLNVFAADLCASVSSKHRDGSGAWHSAAKYLDVYAEPPSYDALVSPQAEAKAANTSFRHILHDNFLRPTGLAQMHSKQRLWRLLQNHSLLERYDWFFFGRTDLLWVAPHVDVRGLAGAEEAVWVPSAGQKSDWGGYYDRAAFVPRRHVRRVLNMLEAVAPEAPVGGLLDKLVGYPGSVGTSTNSEHFYKQYLAFHGVPVRRYFFTAFVTSAGPRAGSPPGALQPRLHGLVNADTGHLFRYTDEYVAALNQALAYFQGLKGGGTEEEAPPAATPGGQQHEHDTGGRLFYVITVEQAERVNATLAGCALSAWALAFYERLLAHPLRTKHVSRAAVAFAPPHFAWDLHWPVMNGARDGNAARRDANFPLPEEGAGYQPYGSSLATSCRAFFSPCGYEGCVPAYGAKALSKALAQGSVLSREGALGVLEQLFAYFNLRAGAQSLVFYDSGAAGPVAYQGQPGALPGGYDLPLRVYSDPRFVFALASSQAPHFRHGRDVSLPTPWTEDVRRYGVRAGPNRTYFLTFKGTFATCPLRTRAAALLHNPAMGVVIVDGGTEEGRSFDFRQLMYNTRFTLILRGDQPYSYRYTEAVCSGSVPVMVSSGGWVPPFSNLHAFTDYGVLVQEQQLDKLMSLLRNISDVEVDRLRYAAKQFCLQHLITVHAQADSTVLSVLTQAEK